MLAEADGRYHYVIIDCPPSLNMLTLNALVASHSVLIPMQCEYYALEGLSALLDTIEGVKQRANPGLRIEGILRTMYDPRSSLTRDVSRQLLKFFGEKVFRTVIPRNIRLAEAPSHGLPVDPLRSAVPRSGRIHGARRRTQTTQHGWGGRGVIKKRGLGRGLDALLGSGDRASDDADVATGTSLAEIAIDEIHPGQYQPRRNIRDEGIAELAASIKAQGVMQPIVLRHRAIGGYEIIAGERRWRASQLAGLDRIPAVIKDVSDERAVAMALIENIQREDLNPLEEALALQRLSEEFHLTQQQAADAVGKSRVAVTNLLRLLNLAPPVREMLAEGELEMGHARALLSLSALEQEQAARQVIARGLSVRQTEALVRQRLRPAVVDADCGGSTQGPGYRSVSRSNSRSGSALLSRSTSTARIPGTLVIRYTSVDELEGILTHLR